MATVFFLIVLAHVVLGFGWAIYKIEFKKHK